MEPDYGIVQPAVNENNDFEERPVGELRMVR